MGLLPTAQRVRDAPLHARGVLGMSCAAAWKEDERAHFVCGRNPGILLTFDEGPHVGSLPKRAQRFPAQNNILQARSEIDVA